ncbi:hypothetical protein AB0J55_17540 [Amycolatopsis sp. NPDC049688]|uniref:hypothetical protein n=1 Tax=Amycolatopsis sp. NPDC049688 TaxID=3154733 RepID=UPI00342726FB
MISTTELTGVQLEQLEALLADTTPGGGSYRPPVAHNPEIVAQLVDAGLVHQYTDTLFDTYEVTVAGRQVVQDHAMDEAGGEAFLREADPAQLRETIRKLKAVFNDLTDPVLRERTLTDIETVQDALDARTEEQCESTGRHRAVPVDDRPTEVLARVEERTVPMVRTGVLDVPDQDSAERLLAAIRGSDTGADVYDEFVAEQTAAWDALEADLADERNWLRRNLTPRRKLVLTVVATVVVTWFAAWLVMG